MDSGAVVDVADSVLSFAGTVGAVLLAFRLQGNRQAVDEFEARLAGVQSQASALQLHAERVYGRSGKETARDAYLDFYAAGEALADSARAAQLVAVRLPKRWRAVARTVMLEVVEEAAGAPYVLRPPDSYVASDHHTPGWTLRLALTRTTMVHSEWLELRTLRARSARRVAEERHGSQVKGSAGSHGE